VAEDVLRASDPDEIARGWRRLGRVLVRVVGATVVILFLLEVVVRLIDDQLPPVDTDDSKELVLKAEQIDAIAAEGGEVGALVFGSSTMDSGISPTAFDAASAAYEGSYNAALIGTPLSTQERWAHEVVLDALDPELVIFGVSPTEVHQDVSTERLAPLDSIFDASFREVESGLLPSLERYATDHSALVRYRGSLRHPRFVVDAVGRTVSGEKGYPRVEREDGYWEQNLEPDGAVLQYRDRTLGPVSQELVGYLDSALDSPYAPERFEQLLDLFEDDDLPVVVVAPPVALAELAAAGADVEAYVEAVAELERTVLDRDLVFIDLTVAYGPELFADPLHLNAAGTEQLSRDLAVAIDAECGTGGCPRLG
jgi:hypothetical protein